MPSPRLSSCKWVWFSHESWHQIAHPDKFYSNHVKGVFFLLRYNVKKEQIKQNRKKKTKTCTVEAKKDGAIGPSERRWMTANYWWHGETVCGPYTGPQLRQGLYLESDKSRKASLTRLPLFPSEASWNGRWSKGLILLLTRLQGIVPSVPDSFQCHSVSSDPHSSNGVLRETARSRLLFHTLSFLTPPANPALFHWTHSERKMKTIPFCPMSHYPPQLI